MEAAIAENILQNKYGTRMGLTAADISVTYALNLGQRSLFAPRRAKREIKFAAVTKGYGESTQQAVDKPKLRDGDSAESPQNGKRRSSFWPKRRLLRTIDLSRPHPLGDLSILRIGREVKADFRFSE